MRGLMVVDGAVANIAVFKEDLPDGWVPVPPGVSLGWLDNGDGSFSKPDALKPTLEEAKVAKVSELEGRFVAETNGTYLSDVLGSPHQYEINRKLVALAVSATRGRSGKVKCVPEGQAKPARVVHTADQLQDLNDEINDWIDTRADHLDTLLGQVEAVEITVDLDTALAELAAIVW